MSFCLLSGSSIHPSSWALPFPFERILGLLLLQTRTGIMMTGRIRLEPGFGGPGEMKLRGWRTRESAPAASDCPYHTGLWATCWNSRCNGVPKEGRAFPSTSRGYLTLIARQQLQPGITDDGSESSPEQPHRTQLTRIPSTIGSDKFVVLPSTILFPSYCYQVSYMNI